MKYLITLLFAVTMFTANAQTTPTEGITVDTLPAFLLISEIPTIGVSNTFTIQGFVLVATEVRKLSTPTKVPVGVLDIKRQPLDPKYIIWNYHINE